MIPRTVTTRRHRTMRRTTYRTRLRIPTATEPRIPTAIELQTLIIHTRIEHGILRTAATQRKRTV